MCEPIGISIVESVYNDNQFLGYKFMIFGKLLLNFGHDFIGLIGFDLCNKRSIDGTMLRNFDASFWVYYKTSNT